MRIECPDCAATYDVQPTEKKRQARCKKCGALMTVEASTAESAAEPEQRETQSQHPWEKREKPRLLVPAIVVAVVSFLVGLIFLPLTLVAGVGTAVRAADGPSSLGGQMGLVLLLAFGMIGPSLIGGGIGLLLRKPWGWWACTVMFGFFLLLSLKLMSPILYIDWDHPRATKTALGLVLGWGIPIFFSIAMLVLLFLPRVRIAYGVKQARLVRHRRAGRLPARR